MSTQRTSSAAGPRPTAAMRPAAAAPSPPVEGRTAVMLERVRASGLKLTPQRIAIVREIAADPTHPTAQELFERLRPALPTMSFATVYNTLDALAATGLCAALSLAPGASRFDPNMEAHHHAVCDRCGLVRDVPSEGADAGAGPQQAHPGGPLSATDSPTLAAAPGFQVRAVERIYRGLCADCAGAVARATRPSPTPHAMPAPGKKNPTRRAATKRASTQKAARPPLPGRA